MTPKSLFGLAVVTAAAVVAAVVVAGGTAADSAVSRWFDTRSRAAE